MGSEGWPVQYCTVAQIAEETGPDRKVSELHSASKIVVYGAADQLNISQAAYVESCPWHGT